MLKKSLSVLLGFILLVSTIPTNIFADSAELSALPRAALNDIIDDGELVLADFSNAATAQQELESLVEVTSSDGAAISISTEHIMSEGATSALKFSGLQNGSSIYIKSKWNENVFPSAYTIRVVFGIKNNDDSDTDKIPLARWIEVGSDGTFEGVSSQKTFTAQDTKLTHNIKDDVMVDNSQTTLEDLSSNGDELRFGFKIRAALTNGSGTAANTDLYIEKIYIRMTDYNKTTLANPTATVADGGVYNISDSYNPHSFALDFAEDVYMASDAVTVMAGDEDITDATNLTLSGQSLNLTFPADIDYSLDYTVSLAKDKLRGATGKTLLADAEYNFTWNIVKMPMFTDGKLVLADFTNNPTEEYINSVITNDSENITLTASNVHYSENALSSLEVKAASDGTFYIKSAYSKDLWPDEYKIYIKFGTIESAEKIRFESSAGLGDGAAATYTSATGLNMTVNPTNAGHLAGTDRVISAFENINEISSSESEVTIRFNIKKSTAFDSYNDNNKFYIEQIYLAADCEPLGYPTPSVAYGADTDSTLGGSNEYTLSFGTALHYGEDAVSVYHGDTELGSDAYTVMLKDSDLALKFKNELADGVYKVTLDSDKILAKNGDVLYGDAEYTFSVNTADSGLSAYYIGTIGASSDYKTARVAVLGTPDEAAADIRFIAAIYEDDELAEMYTDDLADSELKFDSLSLTSAQTVKYMLYKDMDSIVPLCQSVSGK